MQKSKWINFSHLFSWTNGNPHAPASTIMVGHHYPELDGIRAIAILLVIMFHCRFIVMPSSILESVFFLLAEIGWVGVDLFFVLSGFLITGILLDTCGNKQFLARFYQRRILRIFPLYYAALILTAILARVFTENPYWQQPSRFAEFSYWVHLQNLIDFLGLEPTESLVHFWTLAVEEQFYLLWPLVVLISAKSGNLGKLCLLIWVMTIVFRAWYIRSGFEGAYFFTFCRLDGLVLGAFVAFIFKNTGSLDHLREMAIWMAGSSALGILFIRAVSGGFYGTDANVLYFGFPLLAVFFTACIVIVITAHERGKLRSVLRNRQLCQIGKVSFSMYIFHLPIIEFLMSCKFVSTRNFWIAQPLFFILVTTISFVVAWLSYRYFERYFLRLRPENTGV